MNHPQESDPTSRPLAVLLGASNLTRGVSSAVETARVILGSPMDVLIAMGHGRSYGQRSRVLGRSLPGIVQCGLWEALRLGGGRPTYALLTDIGNDVMYGAPVASIVQWVQTCLDRLAESEAEIVMTLLPTVHVEGLTRWRSQVARTVLFPSSRVSLAAAVSSASELNDRLGELGRERGVRLVEHQDQWYGLDPVHIRRRYLPAAWAQMLSGWVDDRPVPPPVSRSLGRWLGLRLATPQRWWLFGRQRGRNQPAARMPGGTTVSLY